MTVNSTASRPRVSGKFIYSGEEKFYIKGVTYGTFRPDENGIQFPPAQTVDLDFKLMREKGINTVRTYTVPPVYLMDAAERNGLKVMAGLPWEQHINFLKSKARINDILSNIRKGVVSCANHNALLCFAIGNEIPAQIVRWLGAAQTEKFLKRIYDVVKQVDENALVTYVNYPTTEYLNLAFLDFQCFNVYLESREKLESYLQRLHNIAGDQPLVLAEIGLDSMRNSEDKQAEVLDWQIRTIFSKGCAGAFVFAWTDEWWRGGFDIEDWDFGLVKRDRSAKPALNVVSDAFAQAPFSNIAKPPFISIVICTYNGSATIRDTLEGISKLTYPEFEVIVVNDGSKDDTDSIVSLYPVKLISTENNGLSSARNTGMVNAKGEIIAYIDDDAYPDPHWLHYLAYSFITSNHAGIGGPNIAPDTDGPVATCVAHAPGGPVHVLLTDDIAEHVPGCNMAFRREVLMEVGGFDPVFRAAGDDVDLCWRIQHTGRTIGYHPSALVWHHRRNSLKAYWKQQKGYGKAEALLEAKWPEKYNEFGHLSWSGRIYGNGVTLPIKLTKDKIFYGVWGSAPFQSIYETGPGYVNSIPLMPEWYLIVSFLGFLSALSFSWAPLILAVPLFIFTLSVVVIQAYLSAAKALKRKKFTGLLKFKYLLLTTVLHIVQPIARLYGRLYYGLTPWRKRGAQKIDLKQLFVHQKTIVLWSEQWKSQEEWLTSFEQLLVSSKTCTRRGGHFDNWDIQAGGGLFANGRCLLTIEEHGAGKQMLNLTYRSHYSRIGLLSIAIFASLLTLTIIQGAVIASLIFSVTLSLLIINLLTNKGRSLTDIYYAFNQLIPKFEKKINDHPNYSEHQSEPGTVRIIKESGNTMVPA
jgi:glycosyltransferase involved in cell wall biosynthesis